METSLNNSKALEDTQKVEQPIRGPIVVPRASLDGTGNSWSFRFLFLVAILVCVIANLK